MTKNKFKTKPIRAKSFSYKLLFLSVALGIAGGTSALLIGLMARGYQVKWVDLLGSLSVFAGSTLAISQQKSNKGNSPDSGSSLLPLPLNPKPSSPSDEFDLLVAEKRKNENYSDVHRYLN